MGTAEGQGPDPVGFSVLVVFEDEDFHAQPRFPCPANHLPGARASRPRSAARREAGGSGHRLRRGAGCPRPSREPGAEATFGFGHLH